MVGGPLSSAHPSLPSSMRKDQSHQLCTPVGCQGIRCSKHTPDIHTHARTYAHTHIHKHMRHSCTVRTQTQHTSRSGKGEASEECQLQVSASKRRADINRHFLPFCVSSLAVATLRCTTLYHATHAYIRLPHKLLQVRVLGGECTPGRLAMKECLGENGRRGKKGRGERGGRREGGRRVIICMHLYLATAWTVLHISSI